VGNAMKVLRQKKYLINAVLSAIAIGIIVFYSICGNSCAYLKGNILGIELQYIGIAYMAVIILLNLFKNDLLIVVCLAAGIGVELYLIGFQVLNDKYCPYCLVFAAIVIVQFVSNFSWSKKWFALSSMILGFALFGLLFESSVFLSYF
jgi:uncharacterized membrane protein